MVNYIQVMAIILAGISVAVADGVIKKVSVANNFFMALKSPWMIVILLLYLVQIVFFIYVFMNNWEIGIVGNFQMAFYSMTVVLIGLVFFGETLTIIQAMGIGFALAGAILMNL